MFHVKHPTIGRWPVRMLPKVVLAGGEAESGLNGNPLSKQPNAIRLPTHQVIAKRLSSQTPAGAKRMSIEQEIARRKARRRKGRIAAVSVVIAASLVIVSVGVWAWHCQVTEQQGYESELMDALRLVTEADETILQIDAIVDDPFAAESEGEETRCPTSVEQTKQLLVDADGSALQRL